MAVEDIFKMAGQSATGAISKAVIEIYDERVEPSEAVVEDVKPRAADTGLGGAAAKIGDAVEKAVETAESVAEAIDAIKIQMPSETAKKKRFEVKFNPSEISFGAVGGGKAHKTNFLLKGNVDIKYQEMQPRIQMSLKLIFDDYERTEAFMLEKFNDPMAMARTGINSAVSVARGKTASVRSQVEGFIGALRNPNTRKVTFYWGKLKYTGVITYVNAQYTMFSTDGNPIRAIVNITILTTDATLCDGYMGQWHDGYVKTFSKDSITNAGSAMQNVSNLLNIKL